ncbi:hypothetical protein VR7878_00990 [Vibrio ruber DSM 16370]|uniref:Uncharacterized protein n=1 Tax=Vibrio ruber (strain DSM 16370 / JCM 11486 / BCRC 17186 / CECT 7878 / LMG 23124 / VR1) TaxID=1123498 RepID=A0A1R4LED6_VIBR1|nr:hypothetical protein [Vibrio ruber]SJN54918.1 hypothetical protein VR7878_00990 [Vibrio ruber DSM 16370]
MSNLSPVWNGPSVLVPLPTDVLLIGQGDVNAASTWADLKNNYYAMWSFGTSAQPAPFADASCPPVGAHLMWTLPNSLRQGTQQVKAGAPVDFPSAPNRWLITRLSVNADAQSLSAVPTVVQGDSLTAVSGDLSDINQYPYYQDTNLGVREIGMQVALADFDGENNGTVDLQAIGPGDVTWSVAYDNVRNVFALHDVLPDETQTYLYSVIGWYADPSSDPLFDLPATSGTDWLSMLEQQFQWTCEDVDQAEQDWLDWQTLFGLSEDWNPDALNLAPQAKAMIEAWHTWQQANGRHGDAPDFPTQSVYHSMVATVQWRGVHTSYGTGAPIGGDGQKKLPSITIANTPESALSTYMATQAATVAGSGITPEDIPGLALTLEAFQRGLLFDMQTDPQWAENMIHNAKFDKQYRGQTWVVARPTQSGIGTASEPSYAGQQSVALSDSQTQLLIQLNQQQDRLNTLSQAMASRRQELYALAMKQEFLTYNRRTISPEAYETLSQKVTQSIEAISGELTANETQLSQEQMNVQQLSAELTTSVGDQYELKAVDLDPIASPADPVVLLSGAEMDTKILPPSYNRSDSGQSDLLPVRVTGQTVTAILVTFQAVQDAAIQITWQDVLNQVTLPGWNAIPKEVLNLWVEMLLLDTSFAPILAHIYFEKAGKPPQDDQLATLIEKIQMQQTVCWTQFEHQPPTEALTQACGFEGLLPDPIGVAYRPDRNPWTPIYMDWQVRWIPDTQTGADALQHWQLGDHDYQWTGSTLEPNTGILFEGRATLNLKTTYNMQAQFAAFQADSNYDQLPAFIVQNLTWVSNNIQYMDLVTQSMSGLTEQLNTLLATMKNTPEDAAISKLLDGTAYFAPQTGTTTQTSVPDFPVRAGHFQVMDLRLIDSFGQVLPGKSSLLSDHDPINDITWSDSMQTNSPNYRGETSTYGQLPPRFSQNAMMFTRLLQRDDDTIASNSSDSTSPICGWVMANHLDDALMVFDASGQSLGEVIKIRRETQEQAESSLTIRWDAAPGTNAQLGADPVIGNVHLQAMINALLKTGVTESGVQSYADLMSAIDTSLWLNNLLTANQGNLAILLGRPLAVVRAEVVLDLAGDPAFSQGWYQTGAHYNDDGTFKLTQPPFVATDFQVRIGDSQLNKNGVMGYFVADDYDTFYAVYGNNSQTQVLQQQLRQSRVMPKAEQMKAMVSVPTTPSSGYVMTDHVVSLSVQQQTVKLTLLMDPFGDLTLTPGSLPGSSVTLPTGPVTQAMDNLSATFRTGPLLLDPQQIQMPTPSEVRGNWSWVARQDVTNWQPNQAITNSVPQASLNPTPLNLIEGWLRLANFKQKS